MKSRTPQLQLRLAHDAPNNAREERWRDGAPLTYLGERVRLQLDTDRKQAQLEQGVLHLPLPPQARPRQIRDAAESWLRAEAARVFGEIARRQAARQHRPTPDVTLSFATRAHWVQPDGMQLRCHWRLIEQPIAIIESALFRAAAGLAAGRSEPDLFAIA